MHWSKQSLLVVILLTVGAERYSTIVLIDMLPRRCGSYILGYIIPSPCPFSTRSTSETVEPRIRDRPGYGVRSTVLFYSGYHASKYVVPSVTFIFSRCSFAVTYHFCFLTPYWSVTRGYSWSSLNPLQCIVDVSKYKRTPYIPTYE